MEEIKRPKYIVIVSQYHHSRHMFVVNANMTDVDYLEKSKKCIQSLFAYKRNNGTTLSVHFGDFEEKYFGGVTRRHNVNDYGDLYFIPCWSISQALYEIKGYWLDSKRQSSQYIKKSITEQIKEHHNVEIINKIISTYFEVL